MSVAKQKQKTCEHKNLRTWYAGGQPKAQCLDCLDAGLEQRLRKQRQERCRHRVRSNGFCRCGKYFEKA